jgi:hypothetical protein
MPGHRLATWLRPLLTLVALAGVLSLAACGGGNGAPNNPYQPGPVFTPLAITPAVATTYSGNPFVFTVTGGTQPYTVLSSDQVALPVVGTLTGNILTVVPGSVGADTSVTLTIRDSAGATTSSAVTVKPALLLPASITITGNPNCSASGADLCSGQDGTATVKLTGPAGAPLASRNVRFDVVQGNFSISSTAPGQPLVQSLTVATDQNGNATVRLVVPVNAATQIATIRATDVTDGSSVVGQFTIAQFINGNSVLSVIPTGTTTFNGPDKTHCASTGSATFFVFGGTPPYTVAPTFPGAVTITGNPVPRSGAGFTITPTGSCFTGLTFAITDSAGRTLLTPPTVDNVFGTSDAAVPFNVAAGQSGGSSSARVSCAGTFTFTITGKAPFHAVATDPALILSNGGTVAASPGTLSVSGFTAGSTVSITIGDASAPQNVDVEKIFCQ